MARSEKGYIIPDGLTADLVVFTKKEETYYVVLIDRKHAPLGKAVPGGFLDPNENLQQCAVREFREECSVDLSHLIPHHLKLTGVYSEPDRDPRGRMVSTAYAALVPYWVLDNLQENDDALTVGLYPIQDVLFNKLDFAFSDHGQIVKDAIFKMI